MGRVVGATFAFPVEEFEKRAFAFAEGVFRKGAPGESGVKDFLAQIHEDAVAEDLEEQGVVLRRGPDPVDLVGQGSRRSLANTPARGGARSGEWGQEERESEKGASGHGHGSGQEAVRHDSSPSRADSRSKSR